VLVGTTVGLGTPIFATAGVVAAWFRFFRFSNPTVRVISTVVFGGGVGNIIYGWVGPFLYNHAEIVLPFAVGNAISATFWYSVLETRFGLQGMAGSIQNTPLAGKYLPELLARWAVPLGGPAVGLLTAATAGYLYPIFAQLLWPADLKAILGDTSILGAPDSFAWMIDLHHELLIPVALPVGLLSGYGLHALLEPFILGTVAGGVYPWTATCLPLLTAACIGSAYYFTACGDYSVANLFWEHRSNVITGDPYSLNVRTGEALPGSLAAAQGKHAAVGVRAFMIARQPLRFLLPWVFDTDNNEDTLAPGGAGGKGDQGAAKLRLPCEDHLVPLGQMDVHERFSTVGDLLLRLKYLQLKTTTHNTHSDIEELKTRAKAEYGLKLPELLKQVEIIILAESRAEQSKKYSEERTRLATAATGEEGFSRSSEDTKHRKQVVLII